MNVEKVSFIIPLYNEEDCLPELINRIEKVKNEIKINKNIDVNTIFINDSSSDNTFKILEDYANKNSHIKVISFTRNFGHQIAISAGLNYCTDDAAIIIDGDLQDPPELIFDLIEELNKGYDVVYAKRKKRKGESIFKLITAKLFYGIINKLSGVQIPKNTGDFRIISRSVINQLNKLSERHRFHRAIIPWLGFNSSFIEYDREKRFAGKTKFSLRKMLNLAINAILSFSTKPILYIIQFSLLCIFLSILFLFYILYMRLFTDQLIPGFATIVSLIILFFGLNSFFIGIIGYYIALIFEQSKKRPLFVIDKTININNV